MLDSFDDEEDFGYIYLLCSLRDKCYLFPCFTFFTRWANKPTSFRVRFNVVIELDSCCVFILLSLGWCVHCDLMFSSSLACTSQRVAVPVLFMARPEGVSA